MNIQANDLPEAVYHFTLSGLRSGTGIRKLRPTAVGEMYGGGAAIKAAGSTKWISVEDCYSTREEARSVALEQLQAARREVNLKHEMAISALNLAAKALEA